MFSYKGFDVYFENVRFAHRAKRSAAQRSAAQRSAEQISGAEERSAAPQRSAAQEHEKQTNIREKQRTTKTNKYFQTSLAQEAPEPD